MTKPKTGSGKVTLRIRHLPANSMHIEPGLGPPENQRIDPRLWQTFSAEKDDLPGFIATDDRVSRENAQTSRQAGSLSNAGTFSPPRWRPGQKCLRTPRAGPLRPHARVRRIKARTAGNAVTKMLCGGCGGWSPPADVKPGRPAEFCSRRCKRRAEYWAEGAAMGNVSPTMAGIRAG
jgi:hypothetical protein